VAETPSFSRFTSPSMVPHATLIVPPFGPGYRTDHIDLLHGVGDLSRGAITAGAINYFVCPGKPTWVQSDKVTLEVPSPENRIPARRAEHPGNSQKNGALRPAPRVQEPFSFC
jgi:hypothetical protein